MRYNTQLGPPFHILVDTNFLNFAVKNRMDVMQGFMDCLYAKCTPYVTDCVMGELEKAGRRFKIALKVRKLSTLYFPPTLSLILLFFKIIKDNRFQRLKCDHKGTYADDCLVQRITQHKCYIVATADRDLKRRIRKIPGVPIMYIAHHRFTIERMPDAYGAPAQ
ncbi:hypothetical protein WR25_17245 isoform F [Diploscapter pachys]|nr:hypothetical protein WR25_17245 isoform D [Diploscapter pachys]PAV90200.1 hypothetical protein WR25_17245 isoform F [Diploscapter pachys]